MNILVYTRQAIRPTRGGIERVADVLRSCLEAVGHQVFCLSGDCRPEEVRDRLMVHSIHLVLNHEANDLARTTVLRQALSGMQVPMISILHLSPKHCVEAFRTSVSDLFRSGLSVKDQILIAVRNSWLYKKLYCRYFGQCYAQVYAMSDAFVLLSEHHRSFFVQMTGIQDTSRLFCIPNPLTVSPPEGISLAKKNTLLFVARLTYVEKRPDLLLRIWQRLYRTFPDWNLVIVGSGSYQSVMQEQIRQHGLTNIEMVGEKEATEFYEEASILCQTSNSEGFGLVLSEASAFGVIPLCFDCVEPASDIVVDGKSGYIIPSFDVDAYVRKLSLLMRDADLRVSFAAVARSHVMQQYSRERIMGLWNHLFSSIDLLC